MSRRIINHLLFGLLALLASTALTGCVYDSNDEPDAGTEEKVFYLTLNVSAEDGFGSYKRTRANDYYFEEPVRENEKINNLRVYIVREDGTLEAMRRVFFNSAYVEAPKAITFKLSRGKKKVYLFANDTSLPANVKDIFANCVAGGEFPSQEFEEVTLRREANAPAYTADQDIPMNESFEVVLDSDEEGPIYLTKDLFVTRVAVKYTFICKEPAETVAVRLNGMATGQYYMPKNAIYNPGKYNAPEVINGIAGRNISSFTAPANANRSTYEIQLTGRTEIELTDENGVKSKAYRYDPIYLMETPGTSFTMSIQLGDGENTGTWFPNRTLPNLPLLPRNTHVVVYMDVKEYVLDCKVDVVPYRGCILDPYFGLERN